MGRFKEGQELIYNGHLVTVSKIYDNKIDIIIEPEYEDEPALNITIEKGDLRLVQLS